MREAWESGIVFCGGGAGAMCWFEARISSSFGIAEPQAVFGGLALLAESLCPHSDIEPMREPVFRERIAGGTLPMGYALDDEAGLHFLDGQLHKAIASRRASRAMLVEGDERATPTTQLLIEDLSGGQVIGPWYKQAR